MNLPLVSVVVLNFNGRQHDYLPVCLRSLLAQTHPALEVIVVDNASSDDSVAYLQTHFPSVQVIANSQNVGFCAGNNLGYAQTQGEFVLFANNDTVFAPDCVAQLVAGAAQRPLWGMVSPKLVRPTKHPTEPPLLDSAGLALRRDFTLRDRGFGEPDRGQFEQVEELFACCGAAAFYRRTALQTVLHEDGTLWDETFVAYYEDGDLAWRLQRAGWRCGYVPTAVVGHHRGGSSPASFFHKPIVYQTHTIKNRYLMILKNASVGDVVRRLPFFLLREGLIGGYLLVHPRLLMAVVRALGQTVPLAWRRRTKERPFTEP